MQRSSWEWSKKSGSGEGAEDKQPSTPGKAADVRRTEQGETTPEGRGGRAGKVEWREQAATMRRSATNPSSCLEWRNCPRTSFELRSVAT